VGACVGGVIKQTDRVEIDDDDGRKAGEDEVFEHFAADAACTDHENL
jgi:hypothetical protein